MGTESEKPKIAGEDRLFSTESLEIVGGTGRSTTVEQEQRAREKRRIESRVCEAAGPAKSAS